MCRSRRCRTFGARICWIVKKFDYINRLLKRFRFRSTRVHGHTLPLVAMHHLNRSCMIVGNILKLLRSPTVASEPVLCVDVICTSRTQRVVGNNSHTAYQHVIFDSAVLLDEAARIDITRTLMRDWFYRRALHTGGWRVSVSPNFS